MKPRTPAQLTLQPFDGPLPPGVAQPVKAKRIRATEEAPAIRDRLMRRVEVQNDTGLSRSVLYRLILAKDFPSQVRLSANSVAWLRSEVDDWIAARVAASRKAAATTSVRVAADLKPDANPSISIANGFKPAAKPSAKGGS